MAQRDSTSAAPLALNMPLDLRSTLHDDIGDEGFDIDMELDGRATARYVVERELGRGGLSVVYAAAQVDAQRQVAIKVPFPHLPDKLALRSRFVREARITAAVSHPNIVRIHDSGVLPDGRPYLVTELIPGESLEQRLERGPLSPEDALFVAEQLLDAVTALGQQGIVHRDIKPSNIMVDSDGTRLCALKLLDLGIAQRVRDTGRESTMAQGPAAGTPMYMAPEQLNGLPVDVRTDVYACGAVLYECMFGLQDDGQRDVRGALRRMRADSIRPWADTGRERYPRALVRVVGTALDPQRKKRFPTAQTMRAALANVRKHTERRVAVRVLRGSASFAAVSVGLACAVYFGTGHSLPAFGARAVPLAPSAPASARAVTPAPARAASEPAAQQAPAAAAEATASAAASKPASALAPAASVAGANAGTANAGTANAGTANAGTASPSSAVPTSAVPAPPNVAQVEPASAAKSAAAAGVADAEALAAQTTARRVGRAQEALAGNDFRSARRHAQSALGVDVRNREALRIIITSSVALHDAATARSTLARYAVWYADAPELAALRAQVAAAH